MAANWSTRACTVEASRVSTRSTPELARVLAMAPPLDVNSAVRLLSSARTEMLHVMAASGMSTATRNSVILAMSPKRMRAAAGAAARPGVSALTSVRLFIRSLLARSGLGPERDGPVGDGNPARVLHAREIHAVEPLVPLGAEGERGADAEVEVPERLEGGPQARPRRAGAGAPERLDHDPRVHESLEADEAVLRDRVARIPDGLGGHRVVLVDQRAVLGHAGQPHVVVARDDLRVDQGPRVVAARRAPVLDEQLQHRVGADERHVGDRDGPAGVPGGADE